MTATTSTFAQLLGSVFRLLVKFLLRRVTDGVVWFLKDDAPQHRFISERAIRDSNRLREKSGISCIFLGFVLL